MPYLSSKTLTKLLLTEGLDSFPSVDITINSCNREYYRNTRDPFTIVVAGQKLCVITSSQDVHAVYKNSSTLTFDDYIRDMMLSFGMTPLSVD